MTAEPKAARRLDVEASESSRRDSPEAVSARLRMAFELFVAAKEIQRLNLRRRNPVASDAELERLLGRWLSKADEPLEGPWSLRLGEDLGRTSE